MPVPVSPLSRTVTFPPETLAVAVGASEVKSAEVDPEYKLTLDSNFTNNSYATREDNRAAAKWYVRWVFWLENLFFAASFFS